MRYETIIAIPVGPTCRLDYVRDTLDSIEHYVSSPHKILLLDDSGKETCRQAKASHPMVEILATDRNLGHGGGLYLNLSRGFQHALDHYEFSVLLRLDTDALLIGPDPDLDAKRHFQQYSRQGIIGSFEYDCNGKKRGRSWPKHRLAVETSYRHLLKNPLARGKAWLSLHRWLKKAQRSGYEEGEHCMGGAYFVSRSCLEKLSAAGCLGRDELGGCTLQEDHLFGIFIRAVGLQHGDFATGSYPMGLRHRGLPMSPQELMQREKKIIHSTRFYENIKEEEIRSFFRVQRTAA